MRRRGLTLAEVLVSVGVLGILSVALLNVFGVTMTTVRHGEGRLAMQVKARETLRRLEPLLSTAIPPNDAQRAIYAPAPGAVGARVRWSSTEDLMGNTPINPRSPSFRLYEILFNAGQLELRQIGPPSPNMKLVATGLDAVTFEHTNLNTIRVRVEVREDVRRADGSIETLRNVLQTMIQVPYYTSD